MRCKNYYIGEVRAAWDEMSSQWFFAAVDIVAVLNEQSDYTKANNYWKFAQKQVEKGKKSVLRRFVPELSRK